MTEAETTTEMEITFRLDGEGRTANTKVPQEQQEDNGDTQLDYSYRSVMTNLQFPDNENREPHQQRIDDLLFDCQISDSGLMPRTFWVPCQGFAPRCALEQLALDVFQFHVPDGFEYEPTTSGAEWWCQLRPSPDKTGRYSMHDNDDKDNENTKEDPFAQGISFHVDKDEDLRILTGGTTYIHPHISTVTYLTDIGSPTTIMDLQVHRMTGEWMVPEEMNGFVSWPACGKHISFDGRYLHAAPCDLMKKGQFEEQIQFEEKADDLQYNKRQSRRHRRVTFLVNIWLNYHPVDVKPFPETMLDKMSGSGEDADKRKALQFLPRTEQEAISVQSVTMSPQRVTEHSSNITTSYTPTQFTWPLGDQRFNTETLNMEIPLETIQKQAESGGNVEIKWEKGTYSLLASKKSSDAADAADSGEGNSEGQDDQGNAKRPRLEQGTDAS